MSFSLPGLSLTPLTVSQFNIFSRISCTETLRPPGSSQIPLLCLTNNYQHTTEEKHYRNFLFGYQPWARSPEGDKFPTEIGSGRVGIGIEGGLLDFLKNWDRVEITVLEFPGQNREKSRFSSTFPVIFRSKTPGKVGLNLDFSRF